MQGAPEILSTSMGNNALAMNDLVKTRLTESAQLMAQLRDDPAMCALVAEVAAICVGALRKGGKILLAGNGGSAADSQHLACELVGRFALHRTGLPAIALTTDTSILTAVGNDYGVEHLFARQVQALGRSGDLFFAISTSGRSPNIIQALKACREAGVTCIGFTGRSGGTMGEFCDKCIRIPHDSTPRIQEGHIVIGHLICEIIERSLFSDEQTDS
jgi:D-sedoheptulose 7-phosphate isomerase